MRPVLALSALALIVPVGGSAIAQDNTALPVKQYEVPWGRQDRPRDPSVHPDGSVFFVGQEGNYVARLDPRTGEFKRYTIEEGAHPHTSAVDSRGIVWYTGNRNGTIGRLDPRTGEVTSFPVPEDIRDPHTMVFDKQGNIWFTAQSSAAVGHFNVTSKAFKIVRTAAGSRPYGIELDSKGHPWFNLFGTNTIGTIDPASFEMKTFTVGTERTRDRRIAISSDDKVYYTDYTRGFLGRLDPKTGKFDEFALPGGGNSLPYAMTIDDQDRVWVAEANPQRPNRLVGFDHKTNKIVSVTEVPGERNTIRHMVFDRKSKMIWFGADAGFISRADVSAFKIAM